MLIIKNQVLFLLFIITVIFGCKSRVPAEAPTPQSSGVTPTPNPVVPTEPIYNQANFVGSYELLSDFSAIDKSNNSSKYFITVSNADTYSIKVEFSNHCSQSPIFGFFGKLASDSSITILSQTAYGMAVSGTGKVKNNKLSLSLQLPNLTLSLDGKKTSNALNFRSDTIRIDDISPKYGDYGSTITITGVGFGKDKQHNIVSFDTQVAEIISATSTTIKVKLPNFHFTTNPIINVQVDNCLDAKSANPFTIISENWKPIPDFGGVGRWFGVGFTIGENIYAGLGSDENRVRVKDFWVFDKSSSTWNKIADFPSDGRTGASSFVINGLAYVGLGHNGIESQNDFYKYDPSKNQWKRIADLPTPGREHSTSFSLNGKGYICNGKGVKGGWREDLWEYDPTTDTWTQKATYPGWGEGRAFGTSYVVNDKAYVGGGIGPDNTWLADWFEYSPKTNTWRQLTSFLGSDPLSFSLNNKGYFLYNAATNLAVYNINTDTWQQINDFSIVNNLRGIILNTPTTAYFGTGFNGNYLKTFWKYSGQ